MQSNDEDRISEACREALDLPVEQRSSFLAARFAAEPELLEAAEAYLAELSAPGSFLQEPDSRRIVASAGCASMVGRWFGPYRVVQHVNDGGMGSVYEAWQDVPIQRRVALKVIKAGMDSAAVIERFEHERQVLARMEHPNIAKVLDAGMTPEGRPYFAMEFVAGEPITVHCDRERLSTRQRLELFKEVCEAVQHAHAKGVIHRDIKPGNVLVSTVAGRPASAGPIPKIIDFGIAKAIATGPAHDEGIHRTGAGVPIGTMSYMSPEQAAGDPDIDVATDVYSLGILLYELLVGVPPLDPEAFRGIAWADVVGIVRTTDPPLASARLSAVANKPSSHAPVSVGDETRPTTVGETIARARATDCATLLRTIRHELEWIPAKAMRKERRQRYATPNALAADIQAYLDGRPLSAGPETNSYRARKWLRRHRWLAGSCATVLSVLVTALVLVSGAEGRADRERQQATIERDRSRDLYHVAREAIDAYTKRLHEDPRIRTRGLEGLRKELLETAVGHYEAITRLYGDEPALQFERGQAYGRLAEITAEIGLKAEALVHFGKALTVFDGLVASQPEAPHYQANLAITLNHQGNLLGRIGSPVEAEAAYRRSIDVWKGLLARPDAQVRDRQALAGGYANLASFLRRSGRPDEALTIHGMARTLREQLVAADPAVPKLLLDLAATYRDEALARNDVGAAGEAVALLTQAADIEERLVAAHPDEPEYRVGFGASLGNIANVQTDLGRTGDAEAAYRRALRLFEELSSAHPTVLDYQVKLGANLNNLATLEADLGRIESAEKLLLRARDVRQALVTRDPLDAGFQHDLAGTLNNLALLWRDQVRLKEASAAYDEALRIRGQLAEAEPPYTDLRVDRAAALHNRANLLAAIGRMDQAEAAATEALGILRDLVAEFPEFLQYRQELARTLSTLGGLAVDRRDWDAALRSYQEDLELRRGLVAVCPSSVVYQEMQCKTHNNLGRTYHMMANASDPAGPGAQARRAELLSDAMDEYRQAEQISRSLAESHPTLLTLREAHVLHLMNRANALGSARDHEPAEDAFKAALEAVQALERDFGPLPRHGQWLASVHNGMGVVFQRTDRRDAAKRSYEKTVEINERLHSDHPRVADYSASLGLGYKNMGDITRDPRNPGIAFGWYGRAVEQLTSLLRDRPGDSQTRQYLAMTHAGRADFSRILGRFADALEDWDRAIEFDDGPARAMRADLASSLAGADRWSEAVDEVTELTRSGDWTADHWLGFAKIYAAASARGIAGHQECADRAIACLTSAVAAGFQNVVALEQDEAFEPIRWREDYQKLVEALPKPAAGK